LKHILITALLLIACETDNGLIRRDGINLWASPPIGVLVESSIDQGIVRESIDWWNERPSEDVFHETTQFPGASIGMGHVPDWTDLEELGIAYLYLDEEIEGLISFCEIVISENIEGDRKTLIRVVKHDLGHCFGLDNDPYSINSIMSSPIVPNGEVTPNDLALIEGMIRGGIEF
jgi:hypothetical protein